MHHRTMYMYTNFQQMRVIKSVKTVHTNIFVNNRKLQKFAREKNYYKFMLIDPFNTFLDITLPLGMPNYKIVDLV